MVGMDWLDGGLNEWLACMFVDWLFRCMVGRKWLIGGLGEWLA